MDIPLSGALFITNPRRRNKRRTPTRDNGYKNTMLSRQLGISKTRVKALKKRTKPDGSPKSDAQYAKHQARLAAAFSAAGGKNALAKGVAGRPKSRKAMKQVFERASRSRSQSTRKNPTMKNNPRTIWHKYLRVMKGKGYSMFELKAGFNTLKKKYPASKGYRGLLGAARKLKPKAHAAKSKTQRAAAAKSRATSKLKRVRRKDGKGYMHFAYRNGKYGLISKDKYNERKGLRKKRKRPKARGKTAVSRTASRRRAAKRVTVPFTRGEETTTWSALVKRHGVKKASKIYRSYGGLSNPKRRRNKAVRRRNPKSSFGALALRKNPGVLGLLDKGGEIVSGFPFVGGFLGPKVAPLGLGAAVAGIHYVALRFLGPKMPGFGAQVGGLLGREEQGYNIGVKAQYFGYSLGGLAVASALSLANKFAPKMFPTKTVNVISTSALLVGAAFDMNDYLKGYDSSETSMDEDFTGDMSGLAYTGGQLNGLAYEGGQLNGLAYEGGALNGAHMNGAHMNGAHMNGMHMNGAHMNGAHLGSMHALNEAYMRASFDDAAFSGPDFDGHEGSAMMGGPRAYMAKFGLPAMRAGRRGGKSSMAGKHGHRWAWLVASSGSIPRRPACFHASRQALPRHRATS